MRKGEKPPTLINPFLEAEKKANWTVERQVNNRPVEELFSLLETSHLPEQRLHKEEGRAGPDASRTFKLILTPDPS